MDCDSDNSNYSDYDEDLRFLKKALYVDVPKDFNPNKIPQNGEEYLQHVMYEARKCPAMVVASVKIKNVKPAMQVTVNDECMKAPESMLPSMVWQDNTIENFTKLRKFIPQQQMQLKSKTYNANINIKQFIHSAPPTLSTVAALSQEYKVKGLEIILEHLNNIHLGVSIDRHMGMWLFTLLSILETPLCPDTCHVLRELARKCSQIRANLPDNASMEDYVPLNLFICLIARYYRQLDLADE